MDDKEILELIKSNTKLSTQMESIQKDLGRLVNLIEKDVKEDLESLDKRVNDLEMSKEKFSGTYAAIAVVAAAMFSLVLRFAPMLISTPSS